MEIRFGKFKGKTLEEIVKTEEGKGWLAWFCEEESRDDEYKEKNDKMKDEIRAFLSKIPQKKSKEYNSEAQIIISKLDEILDLLGSIKRLV